MSKDIFKIANKKFKSRLIVGTGKYKNMADCAKAIKISGADIVTVAVRRVNIIDKNKPLLMDYINTLENILGIEAKKNFMEIQPGDVKSTSADTSKLDNWVDFKPAVNIQTGIKEFVKWYREYYK